MNTVKILVDHAPDDAAIAVLRAGIVKFNSKFLHEKASQLIITAQNNKNEVVGGATIWQHSDAFYIDILWIEESYREMGIGTRLMHTIVEEAKSKNIYKLFVDTYDFQASSFYIKHGFLIIGQLDAYLLGHDRIYLRMDIGKPEIEKDGSLSSSTNQICIKEKCRDIPDKSAINIHDIELLPATLEDYPIIQNMARFYVYDRTPFMGWACSENGLFECIDFKHYFVTRGEAAAFLIRVHNEIAGFVLLDKMHLMEAVDWNMGEFFVLAKFQGKGVAAHVAQRIFKERPGKWSVAVMPENIKAVKFWRKTITTVSKEAYTEIFKTEDELRTVENPDPYAMNVFSFTV